MAKQDWGKVSNPLTRQWSDPDKAKALHKLIIQHINRRLEELPDVREKAFAKTLAENPGLGAQALKKDIKAFLKKTDPDGLYREISNLGYEKKALRRGLAEFLTTDVDFFERNGVLEALSTPSDSPLWRRLKSWDGKFSGYKSATKQVGHHTTLSALNDMLNSASTDWRNQYNAIAKEHGYKLGDRGLLGLDPGAHKAFDTVKNKPHIWSVKGKVANRLSKLLPDLKWDGDALHLPKQQYPEIDKAIKKLQSISSHGYWAGGEEGFKTATEISKLSPEKAFESSRGILDAEQVIAKQGHNVDKTLEFWENRTKGNTNLDDVVGDLNRSLNNPKIQPEDIKNTVVKEAKDLQIKALAEGGHLGPHSKLSQRPVDTFPGMQIKNAPVEPKGGILRIIKKGAKTALKGNLAQKIATAPVRAAGTPLGGGQQGEALGNLARTGDKKYIKDLAIASGTDIAMGSAFNVGAKAIGQRALTKGLIKKGLARAALGTVAGPVGWALLGYSALDTANAFTKAYTGKGLVGHAKNLFIKNQDNPAKGVQIASTKYTPNPVWKMTPQDKKDHMNNMIKRWQSGEETVPLPSDISGPHMRI